MEKKVVGYARLSSKEQTVGITLEQQIDRLRGAGATEIYHDIESGRKDNRTNFQNLLNQAREGKICKIICTRLDRFSRKTVTAISTIYELINLNVEILLLDTPIGEMNTAAGKLMVGQLAVAAQFESDMLSDRVQHGLNYKKKLGLVTAGQGPFGYTITPQDKLELDRRPLLCLLTERPKDWLLHQQYYEEIYKSKLQVYDYDNDKYCNWDYLLADVRLSRGRSRADIARDIVLEFLRVKTARGALKAVHIKYGIPQRNFEKFKKLERSDRELALVTESHISNWLMNPNLRGHMAYLNKEKSKQSRGKLHFYHHDIAIWDIVPDTHPDERLISDEEWEIISVMLKTNAVGVKLGKDSNICNLYSGLLFCKECGARLNVKTLRSKKYTYYHCRKIGCSNSEKGKSITENDISKVILARIQDKAIDIQSNIIQQENNYQYKSDKLIKLEEGLEKIKILLQHSSDDSILLQAKNDYIIRINEEKNQMLEIPIYDRSAGDIARIPEMRNFGYLLTLDRFNLKLVVFKLIRKIYIHNAKVEEIIFNI